MKTSLQTESSNKSKSVANNFSSDIVQTKLQVGKPDDKYEQEAEQTANRVMMMPETPLKRKEEREELLQNKSTVQRQPEEEETIQPKLFIQRQVEEEEETVQAKLFIQKQVEQENKEANLVQKKSSKTSENSQTSTSFTSLLNSRKGVGHSLPETTRSFMERSIGSEFSQVKIHSDNDSAQLSNSINAQAFTTGYDIFFNQGKYNPDTSVGKHLLAHELTHVVQQNGIQRSPKIIQRSWLGDAWDAVKGVASDIGHGVSNIAHTVAGGISSVAGTVASGLTSAWSAATRWLGGAAASVWSGLKSIGSAALSWLSRAGSHVWSAIKWFGSKAFDIIKAIGTYAWEKLSVLGTNVWSFISNFPIRVWRIIVHGWEGIKGAVSWVWSGLSGAAKHLWNGVKGVFSWLGRGLKGVFDWLANGVINGFKWAIDFIKNPSLDKLWHALTGSLSWAWSGLKGFAKWGWDGVVGAAIWVWRGARGFGSWLWDGFLGRLEWVGRMLLYVLDLVGLFEALEILWGLIFRLRKLTSSERSASLMVHPAGMIPYGLVWVDEGSWVARISGFFSGGGYRAVTTAHVIHTAPHEPLHTMVHELTHVAQYEHVGSVYMAEAIHAQAVGGGYNYKDAGGALLHQHFWEFNREQQAQICEDYYIALTGGSSAPVSLLAPLISEMKAGRF